VLGWEHNIFLPYPHLEAILGYAIVYIWSPSCVYMCVYI